MEPSNYLGRFNEKKFLSHTRAPFGFLHGYPQLETGEMDMDRKDRKDKTSFVWSSRIHGDTPGSEGLRPASLSVTMGMPTPGTPFAGALFRTTGVPFVDPRAAHVAVPPPGLANSSDPPRELSLGELLLEKWPPAPISELTTTETS